MSLLSLAHGIMPHSTTIAMPNSSCSHIGVVSIVHYSSKVFLNHAMFENMILMENLCNFNIFQMVYNLLHSDNSFRNNCENTLCEIEKSRNPNHLYSNLLLNRTKSTKMINMRKLCLIHSFLIPYHFHQSNKRFENAKQNSVQKWKIRKIDIYYT
jgi:hypothetical protein